MIWTVERKSGDCGVPKSKKHSLHSSSGTEGKEEKFVRVSSQPIAVRRSAGMGEA